ncbi:MAG: glucose-6-phosphate dehydrogenase assembly protein OpcA [Rhabdochlamydiaceae bacterium]
MTLRSSSKLSASLFNLIIYTKQDSRIDYIHSVLETIVEKIPCHIIFISVDDSAPTDYFSTSTSAMNNHPFNANMAYDIFAISCSVAQRDKIPFILLPKLISDVPIYLLWADDLDIEDTIFCNLSAMSSRVIFDSEITDNIHTFAKNVVRLHEHQKYEIADLNWARLDFIRSILANSVNYSLYLESLTRTAQIEVEYNNKPSLFFTHPSLQALYLQNWVANCLGWKSKGVSNPSLFLYEYENQEKLSHLKENYRDNFPTGMVLSLRLSVSSEEYISLCLKYGPLTQIEVKLSCQKECPMPQNFILPKTKSGQSLINTIFGRGCSSHYFDVLKNLSLNH